MHKKSTHKGLRARVEGRGRIIAVGGVIAAVLAVGIGGSAAADRDEAAKATVGSPQLKDGGVYSPDLHDGAVRSPDLRNGGTRMPDLAPSVKHRINTTKLSAASLEDPVTVEHIGGPISDNFTDTGIEITLPAGTYLFDLSGAFSSDMAAGDPTVDVYPQLSLWLDLDNDGAFEWQDGEGADLSPNATMPTAANRHISVGGKAVVELDQETSVKVLAFGYASDQSSKRSGEIDVAAATLSATPLR